ncbi:GTP:adenosylcobinamide-phosphate guanylyltransferase [Sphingomonas insulae]|uniref:Nucleotidyltransferase family protein n=1 Tax=Sphingomonas insulae TaxID=424800 RepID=A0ABN1HPU2_9SPHN|nr:nucleotidyltransferase family protein [Sphingomonas insulae]NIJ31313.1 GTP:adenosylcobinamide-phosphate guanylyltransferase [Sphingomonas insulae]
MSFHALVLAGSRGGPDPVADHAGVADKALIRIDGATMLERVVTALREAGAVRIAVSANAPAVRAEALRLGTEPLAAAAGPSASTLLGLQTLGAPLLVTTADHALLRAEWVRAFLADAPGDSDVAALLASRDAIERDSPPTRRTYLRFADGAWSGCNLFLCRTPAAEAAIGLWMSVERDRKRPWRIVRRLGPGTLLRYATGRLTLQAALARLGATVGVRAAAVAARNGLAAVDVDTPADLDLVRAILADGAAQPFQST